jgi:hypothetical protein
MGGVPLPCPYPAVMLGVHIAIMQAFPARPLPTRAADGATQSSAPPLTRGSRGGGMVPYKLHYRTLARLATGVCINAAIVHTVTWRIRSEPTRT